MSGKLLLIIFIFVANISHSQNLVLNPGFETATVGLPGGTSLSPYPVFVDNWASVTVDGEFMYDLSLAHTGTGFLSVLQNPAGNPQTFWLGSSGGGGYDRAIQLIPVSPSTTYELSFWSRHGDGLRYSGYAGGDLLVQIEQTLPGNIVIDSFSVFLSSEWQHSVFTFTTGTACTEIALLLSCYAPAAVDAWIDDMDLHPASATGVDNPDQSSGIVIYPNPSTDHFIIKSGTNETLNRIIYDVASRIHVQQSFKGEARISTADFAKGIYLYQIYGQSGFVSQGKLIKE